MNGLKLRAASWLRRPELSQMNGKCTRVNHNHSLFVSDSARKLRELDTNNDGYVSEEEWQAAEFSLPVAYGVLLGACRQHVCTN